MFLVAAATVAYRRWGMVLLDKGDDLKKLQAELYMNQNSSALDFSLRSLYPGGSSVALLGALAMSSSLGHIQPHAAQGRM